MFPTTMWTTIRAAAAGRPAGEKIEENNETVMREVRSVSESSGYVGWHGLPARLAGKMPAPP